MERPRKIALKNGTDVHRLVVNLIKQGVPLNFLQAATGQPRHVIAALKAHITMGTY